MKTKAPPMVAPRTSVLLWNLKRSRTTLLMLAPATILVFVFSYLPMAGIVLAFKQFNYQQGIFRSPWVGMENFRFFFISGRAASITANTFRYNLTFMVVNTFLKLLFAIILSEMRNRHYKKLTQSVMFFPTFISWVVVGSIAYNIFNFEHGFLNAALKLFGAKPLDIYNTPAIWKYLLVAFKAWKDVGYGVVVYMAAIVSIDTGLYEAAEIDGANLFQRIFRITLPLLVPTIVLLTLLDVGQIFRGDFGLFYQLVGSNGRLYNATDIIDTYVFRALLQSSDVGMAAAAGLYQSVLCFITIMLTNAAVKRVQSDYALF